VGLDEKQRQMTDDNLPANLPSDFNDEEIKMKQCPACGGLGKDSDNGHDVILCHACKGEGEIEMTHEEIFDENEKEPNDL